MIAGLLIGSLAFAGSRLPTPGGAELTQWVQDSEVGELLEDVRNGVSERLQR